MNSAETQPETANLFHESNESNQENAESIHGIINPISQAACRVIYVRVTPDELRALKSQADHAKLSLQRHARIILGLMDRGGYRNRKEQPNAEKKSSEQNSRDQTSQAQIP